MYLCVCVFIYFVCVCEGYSDVKWNQCSLLWGLGKKEKLIGVIICQSLRLGTGKFSLCPPEGQINFIFFFNCLLRLSQQRHYLSTGVWEAVIMSCQCGSKKMAMKKNSTSYLWRHIAYNEVLDFAWDMNLIGVQSGHIRSCEFTG